MSQSVWATPRRATSSPPAPRVVAVAPVRHVAVQPPRATSIAYYDSSRVIDNIKVVKDLRQSGSERGEVQSGDNGTLGPGSIAPNESQTTVATKSTQSNLVPIALAIAAFILLGG